MATFLTLVNLVCNRLNEVNLTSSSFTATDGAHATIKDSINASIRDIQREYPEWPWNRVSRNFATVAGTVEYTPAADVGNVDWDTFSIQKDTPNNITAQWLQPLEFTMYAQYRRSNDQQMTSDQWAKPQYVVRSQSNTFLMSPYPNTVYTIVYDAWTVPDELVAYSDISVIPDKYNSTVVEGALKYMYQFRSDDSAKTMSAELQKEGIAEMLRIEISNPIAFKSTIIPRGNSYSWVASRTF